MTNKQRKFQINDLIDAPDNSSVDQAGKWNLLSSSVQSQNLRRLNNRLCAIIALIKLASSNKLINQENIHCYNKDIRLFILCLSNCVNDD